MKKKKEENLREGGLYNMKGHASTTKAHEIKEQFYRVNGELVSKLC